MELHRFRISPEVRASHSTDGLVLLDIRGGLILASNPVGARIWQLLEQRCTSRQIAQHLVEDYGIEHDRAETDVSAFVRALVSRGLVLEDTRCDPDQGGALSCGSRC